jgi:hypothetical protein
LLALEEHRTETEVRMSGVLGEPDWLASVMPNPLAAWGEWSRNPKVSRRVVVAGFEVVETNLADGLAGLRLAELYGLRPGPAMVDVDRVRFLVQAGTARDLIRLVSLRGRPAGARVGVRLAGEHVRVPALEPDPGAAPRWVRAPSGDGPYLPAAARVLHLILTAARTRVALVGSGADGTDQRRDGMDGEPA